MAERSNRSAEIFVREYLPLVRRRARELGYAVAVHGSLARDVDLVAVAWVDDAAPAEDLVAAVREEIGGGWITGEPGQVKPHGRLGWALRPGALRIAGTYIDLSVIPPRG